MEAVGDSITSIDWESESVVSEEWSIAWLLEWYYLVTYDRNASCLIDFNGDLKLPPNLIHSDLPYPPSLPEPPACQVNHSNAVSHTHMYTYHD